MTGEPTHTASKQRMAPELMFSSECPPQRSNTASKAIMLYFQLCSTRYTVLQMKNNRRSASAIIQSHDDLRTPTVSKKLSISYCLKSAAAITLHFQLYSAHYTALQTKNSVKIVSATNPITTENMDSSHLQTYCREAMHRATANQHLGLSEKGNGT